MKDFWPTVSKFSVATVIATAVTLLVGNLVFNEIYDKFILATELKVAAAIAYLCAFFVLIMSLSALCICAYFLLRGDIIATHINEDKEGIIFKLKEKIENLENANVHILAATKSVTDATKAIQNETGNLYEQTRATLTSLSAEYLVSIPSEYGRLLIDSSRVTNPATQLTLVGTMAGFCFTVGNALPEYIAKVKNFGELKIFTTARVSPGDNDNTILYAVFLIMSTIRRFVELNEHSGVSEARKLTVQVGYMKRDIFSAALMIPGHECVILPALKGSALKGIVEDKATLLGLRYRGNHPQGAPIYARYLEVLNGHEQRYLGDSKEASAAPDVWIPPEKWVIEIKPRGQCSVKVTSSRWCFKDDEFVAVLNAPEVVHSETEICSGTPGAVLTELGRLIQVTLTTQGAGRAFSELLKKANHENSGLEYAFAAP